GGGAGGGGRDSGRQDQNGVSRGRGEAAGRGGVGREKERSPRRFFGDAPSALGRRVGFGGDPGTPTDMEIVGVVKDIKYTNLRDEIPIQMFVPYFTERHAGNMNVYVRAQLAPEGIIATARDHVRRLDPHIPLYH